MGGPISFALTTLPICDLLMPNLVRPDVLALRQRVPREERPAAGTCGQGRGQDRAEFGKADKPGGRVNDPDHLAAGVIVAPPDQLVEQRRIRDGRERGSTGVHRHTHFSIACSWNSQPLQRALGGPRPLSRCWSCVPCAVFVQARRVRSGRVMALHGAAALFRASSHGPRWGQGHVGAGRGMLHGWRHGPGGGGRSGRAPDGGERLLPLLYR